LKLGFELSEATVAKYVVRHRTPPSQTWRTFLANHMKDIVSSDFFGNEFSPSKSCKYISRDALSINAGREYPHSIEGYGYRAGESDTPTPSFV